MATPRAPAVKWAGHAAGPAVAPAVAPPKAADSSPKAVAAYLVELRPLIARDAEHRRAFIREIGLLVEGARSGKPHEVAIAAGRVGRDYGMGFREAHQR